MAPQNISFADVFTGGLFGLMGHCSFYVILDIYKMVAEDGKSIWIWNTIIIESPKELSLSNTSAPLQKQFLFNRYACP